MKLGRRQVDEDIPTSSMADIAFLLIIYFMVTTTFTATRGLDFALPQEEDTPPMIENRALAAAALEAAAVDLVFEHGRFVVAGTDRGLDIFEVAGLARAAGAPLAAYAHFERDAMTYPNGCHVAEVVIDPETGQVVLERYVAVDDYGVLINPLIKDDEIEPRRW